MFLNDTYQMKTMLGKQLGIAAKIFLLDDIKFYYIKLIKISHLNMVLFIRIYIEQNHPRDSLSTI